MTGWRLSSTDSASRMSSIVMDVGSDETSSTCVHAVTSSVGETCGASSDETRSTGDSIWSDAASGNDEGGISEDLSDCEWSGRKWSGAGSDVSSSAGSVALETGSAAGVWVAHGHCCQSLSLHSIRKVAVTKHHSCLEPDQDDAGW